MISTFYKIEEGMKEKEQIKPNIGLWSLVKAKVRNIWRKIQGKE